MCGLWFRGVHMDSMKPSQADWNIIPMKDQSKITLKKDASFSRVERTIQVRHSLKSLHLQGMQKFQIFTDKALELLPLRAVVFFTLFCFSNWVKGIIFILASLRSKSTLWSLRLLLSMNAFKLLPQDSPCQWYNLIKELVFRLTAESYAQSSFDNYELPHFRFHASGRYPGNGNKVRPFVAIVWKTTWAQLM